MSTAVCAQHRPPDCSLETAQLRAQMLDDARRFFSQHDVLEVDTPLLSRYAVSDPAIESIGVQATPGTPRAHFLATSPEFSMKRLLCAGWPDIYQIGKVFRDGEVGRRHQPEFTLVEWYRLGLSLRQMIAHTVEFIGTMVGGTLAAGPPVTVSYVDAFADGAGVHPLDDDLATLADAAGGDRGLAESLAGDRDSWLDLLLSQRIAPQFVRDRLTVLHHYPASQAALSRLCPEDRRLADRFEIFLGELELANGYFELSDADEQRRRCAGDQLKRQRRGQACRPLDPAFLAALDAGLPACCGVAVGFDRLLMIRAGATDIRDVLTFSFQETDHE